MKLSLIVAMDRDGLIGRDGGLPWPRIPEDMRLFRRLTMGRATIVGRETWEGLGASLPGRGVIVMTRAMGLHYTSRKIARSPGQAIEWAGLLGHDETCVIGGAETYAEFRDLVDEAHVTLVDGAYEGDTYFPIPLLDSPEWEPAADPVPLAPNATYHKLRRKGVRS